MDYEYKVVPAPAKGKKSKGIRSAEDRFAHALESRMNGLAEEGWEYVRCDTLPSEERVGLRQSQTVWRNVLIFRRAKAVEMAGTTPMPRDDRAETIAHLQEVPPPRPHMSRATQALPELETAEDMETGKAEAAALLKALPGPLRARALRLRAQG